MAPSAPRSLLHSGRYLAPIDIQTYPPIESPVHGNQPAVLSLRRTGRAET